jgi:hypothetical protein
MKICPFQVSYQSATLQKHPSAPFISFVKDAAIPDWQPTQRAAPAPCPDPPPYHTSAPLSPPQDAHTTSGESPQLAHQATDPVGCIAHLARPRPDQDAAVQLALAAPLISCRACMLCIDGALIAS